MHPTRQQVEFDHHLLDKDAVRVVKTLSKAGFETYLVGGCVRDLLLGLAPKDFDVATSAKPEQVHKLFKRSRIIGRRFRLVHVMFSSRRFIEVATFRSGQVQTGKSGVIVRDNCYGSIEDDVVRRDFKINALYYDLAKREVIDYVDGLSDIEQKEIHIIGDVSERFEQDPVRMIRAVRFKNKLDFELSPEIDQAIHQQAPLITHIAPARLYEECIKLFHNEYGYAVFKELDAYRLLEGLFAQTKDNAFIKRTLENTSLRIRQNKPVTPAFMFAVFLWQAHLKRYQQIKKKQKSDFLARQQAAHEVLSKQLQQVSMPRYLTERIKDIWLMQPKLEKKHPKKVKALLTHPRFRMGYDFLLLRSQSIDPELEKVAAFWTNKQH